MSIPKVFISYAREDMAFKKELETIIIPMERDGLIQSWHDGLIQAGDSWDDEIKKNLHSADIVICLLSRSFNASKYIYKDELPPVLEGVRQGKVRLIPIMARKINLDSTLFGSFQCLPLDNYGRLKAINEWIPVDPAWAQIDEEIRAIVSSFGTNASSPNPANSSSTTTTLSATSNTIAQPIPLPTDLAGFKLALNRLLANDNIKKAMDEFDKAISKDSSIFNSLIQLQARYNRNKKNAMMGLSTAQHTAVEEARITNSLQYLIEELNEEDLV